MTRVRLTIRGGFDDRPDIEVYEGANHEEVMDRWNDTPYWRKYPPEEFRKHMVWMAGADIHLPATDDDILDTIAAQNESMTLEVIEESD